MGGWVLRDEPYAFELRIERLVLDAGGARGWEASDLLHALRDLVASAANGEFAGLSLLDAMPDLAAAERAAGIPWRSTTEDYEVVLGRGFVQQTWRSADPFTWRIDDAIALWHRPAAGVLAAYDASAGIALMSPTEFLPLITPVGAAVPRHLALAPWRILDAAGTSGKPGGQFLCWANAGDPENHALVAVVPAESGAVQRAYVQQSGGRRLVVAFVAGPTPPGCTAWPVTQGTKIVWQEVEAQPRVEVSAWRFANVRCCAAGEHALRIEEGTLLVDRRGPVGGQSLGRAALEWPAEIQARVEVQARPAQSPRTAGLDWSAPVGWALVVAGVLLLFAIRFLRVGRARTR